MIVMNSDHRLANGQSSKALALVRTAVPNRRKWRKSTPLAGMCCMRLYLGLQSFVWGSYASDHDAKIGRKLAYVLCGGDFSAPAWVDPWYILDLEREAFLSLAGEEKTQARVMHMLQTGKPLRN